jgi:hypothetical protein
MARRHSVGDTRGRPRVEYYPPSQSTISQFAQKVCRGLGETLDDRFDRMDVHHGLASFLKVVASICAQKLNREQSSLLDRDSTPE